MYEDRAEMPVFMHDERAVCGSAECVRLVQDRVEYRREVAGRGIDDPKHLGGRGLLLQSLARLGDEPRVLHRNDRLRREILQQRDLLLGKGPDLAAIGGNRAEQPVVLEQRHDQEGADADLHRDPKLRVFASLSREFREIRDLNKELAAQYARERVIRPGTKSLPRGFRKPRRGAMRRRRPKPIAVIGEQDAELGAAKLVRLFQNRVEYRG